MSLDTALSPAEAARRLGISRDRVIQISEAGHLPAIRTSLGRLFTVEAVEQLAADRERAGRG